MIDQIPFTDDGGVAIEFADNPDPRCPCVLLLDVSGSMAGPRIDELNKGLLTYAEELRKDQLASRRVEIAIVTFGGSAQVVNNFNPASVVFNL